MVEDESYHLPVAYHDDQPNSYDETIPHDSPESGEIPTPYHEPPALQPTTPSGALGPGGFSPPDDPSEVAGLRDQVGDDASMAIADIAARDAAFAELVVGAEHGSPNSATVSSLAGLPNVKSFIQQANIANPELFFDESSLAELISQTYGFPETGSSPHFQLISTRQANPAQRGVGHHYMSISVITDNQSQMTAGARDVALGNYSGSTFPKHHFGTYGGVSHKRYNEIVAKEFRNYMKSNNITIMNADQMLDFSEKMRNGLDHEGNPQAELKSFNNEIARQRDAYVRANPKLRGLKGGRTLEDYLQRGKEFRTRPDFVKVTAGILLAGVLASEVEQQVTFLKVASESQNFRLAVEALHNGDLPSADRYIRGPQFQLGGFVGELIDNRAEKAALNFQTAWANAMSNATIIAGQLQR